jgi:hypothetical protein
MSEESFPSWAINDRAAIHAAHVELVRRVMRRTSPPRFFEREDETDRGRAETKESFAHRVAARRRQLEEGVSHAAD